MSNQEYIEITEDNHVIMSDGIAEIMNEITYGVVSKLGRISLPENIADEMPPSQRALLLMAVNQPGFTYNAARNTYDEISNMRDTYLSYQRTHLEEGLYEKGITAAWHVDDSTRRPKHELIVYYIKE